MIIDQQMKKMVYSWTCEAIQNFGFQNKHVVNYSRVQFIEKSMTSLVSTLKIFQKNHSILIRKFMELSKFRLV